MPQKVKKLFGGFLGHVRFIRLFLDGDFGACALKLFCFLGISFSGLGFDFLRTGLGIGEHVFFGIGVRGATLYCPVYSVMGRERVGCGGVSCVGVGRV